MLIPVYVAGFILGGVVLFAIAGRIPHRNLRISLRAIGVLAGPIFFLVVGIFSGWKREKTYDVEWLTGASAAEFIMPGTTTVSENKDAVVLRRYADNDECYNAFISRKLADYLEGLPTHTVAVEYTVTYDLFRFRTYSIQRIGNLEYHPNGTSWRTVGNSTRASCFSW